MTRDRFFVLRRQPLGEYDDLLVALGFESGRFSAVVKGSRKPRSRLLGLLEPPVELEGAVREGPRLSALSQLQLRSAYTGLRKGLPSLLTAGFLSRLFTEALPERLSCEEAYELFGSLLERLAHGEDVVGVALWGQDKLLSALGLEVEVHNCLGCGSGSLGGYSAPDGGMLCNSCYRGSGFAVSRSALESLRGMRACGFGERLPLLPRGEHRELGRVMKAQFQQHLGVPDRVFRPVLPKMRP